MRALARTPGWRQDALAPRRLLSATASPSLRGNKSRGARVSGGVSLESMSPRGRKMLQDDSVPVYFDTDDLFEKVYIYRWEGAGPGRLVEYEFNDVEEEVTAASPQVLDAYDASEEGEDADRGAGGKRGDNSSRTPSTSTGSTSGASAKAAATSSPASAQEDWHLDDALKTESESDSEAPWWEQEKHRIRKEARQRLASMVQELGVHPGYSPVVSAQQLMNAAEATEAASGTVGEEKEPEAAAEEVDYFHDPHREKLLEEFRKPLPVVIIGNTVMKWETRYTLEPRSELVGNRLPPGDHKVVARLTVKDMGLNTQELKVLRAVVGKRWLPDGELKLVGDKYPSRELNVKYLMELAVRLVNEVKAFKRPEA